MVELAPAQIVANEAWGEGMGSSIRVGVEALKKHAPDASGVLLMICDQPSVTAGHLRRMIEAFLCSTQNAVASVYANRRGTPAIFPRAALDSLRALHGDNGARSLLARPSWPVTEIPLHGGEVDIDVPEDLAQLR
jgi:molybdenum cofactor cytidylyltransferase